MKIGIMTDLHTPYVSGVTRHIDLCRERFAVEGYRATVFTFGDDPQPAAQQGVVHSPAITRILPFGLDRYPLGWRYSPRARDLLRTMDVVHAHHPFTSARLALRLCKPLGIPVVFTVETRYDLHARAYLPRPLPGIYKAFLRSWLPKLCSACDLVIAPSTVGSRMLERLGVRSPVEVVPNGVDLRPFRTGRPERRTSKGRERGQLIYVGRLAPEKQLSLLLEAFALLVTGGDRRVLVIVGDGPSRHRLELQARQLGIAARVQFTGHLEPGEIPHRLAAAEVFVTPSASEVHPLSVIEAMAAALPVVGVMAPGVGSLVRDGHDGLLSAADAESLAVALRKLADPELCLKLGRNAIATSERYSIDRTSRILLDHYDRLVRNRRVTPH